MELNVNQQLMYDLIYSEIRKENRYFHSLVGQGIFFPPELYLAVQIGKCLKENSQEVFEEELDWWRETALDNSNGPVDLIFARPDNENPKNSKSVVAIELKLRQTYHAYISDVKKLSGTQGLEKKYFIALVDSYKEDTNEIKIDGRIEKLESECKGLIQRISQPKYFDVKEERYPGRDIVCVLGIWEVK